jgi:hypothetical protein
MRHLIVLVTTSVFSGLTGCSSDGGTEPPVIASDDAMEDAQDIRLSPTEQEWPLKCDVPGESMCAATGRVRDVRSAGGTLYVSDDEYGILIYDVSQPNAGVIELSEMPELKEVPRAVAVRDNHLYLGDASLGAVIINVTDPTNPAIRGVLDLPGYTRHVLPVDNYAYIADDFIGGFHIADISDLDAPTKVASLENLRPSYRIIHYGNLVYVTGGYEGLFVVDVSNPQNPILLQTIELDGHVWDGTIHEGYLFVASDTAGVHILSLEDPIAPQLATTLNTPGHARVVRIRNNRMYIADGTEGLPKVEADPGGYWGEADGTNALQIADISDPLSPFIIGAVDAFGYTLSMWLDDTRLYLGTIDAGVRIFDIANDPITELGVAYRCSCL